jgi:hypothetical protein
MKNIHLIPTDKPSRLFKVSGELKLTRNFDFYNGSEYQNIYITNDEEIKEGDWVFNFEYNYIVQYNSEKHDNKFWYKKIILTTDQDLIKDGVQAIDDTFLEWFVNNPSCEEVKVADYGNVLFDDKVFHMYKIIIPQEEPKRKIDTCYNFDKEIGCVQDICRCEQEKPKALTKLEIAKNIAAIGIGKEKPKQETLEEAAERIYDDNLFEYQKYRNGFIQGAKWQVERMYSEEEVDTLLEMLKRSIAEINHIKHTYKDRGHCVKYLSDCESAIEQLKKK